MDVFIDTIFVEAVLLFLQVKAALMLVGLIYKLLGPPQREPHHSARAEPRAREHRVAAREDPTRFAKAACVP